jgi:hypothetical protein
LIANERRGIDREPAQPEQLKSNRSRARWETAEAELDLLRIRKFRAWLFETHRSTDGALSDRLVELNENLAKLERYERRAFSQTLPWHPSERMLVLRRTAPQCLHLRNSLVFPVTFTG